MSKMASLSGAPWHMEYHTVDPKKKKAADCIYLDSERICNCKECATYLALCFEATHCTFRKKENDKKESHSALSHTGNADKNNFSGYIMPEGTKVTTKNGTEGIILKYENEQKRVTILFTDSGKEIKYGYPVAFLDGHLTTSEENMKRIKKRIANG